MVIPGRSFFRQMIEFNNMAYEPICLSQAFHSDLARWRLYLKAWNGIHASTKRGHDETKTTAASESWGCGVLTKPMVTAAMGIHRKSLQTSTLWEGDAAYSPIMCYLGQQCYCSSWRSTMQTRPLTHTPQEPIELLIIQKENPHPRTR